MTNHVILNPLGMAAFNESPAVDAIMSRLGDDIAQDAAQLAPKASGKGAESIDYEVGHGVNGPYVRVSWDRDHFYMFFVEVGTSTMDARPFLRPALEKHRHIT